MSFENTVFEMNKCVIAIWILQIAMSIMTSIYYVTIVALVDNHDFFYRYDTEAIYFLIVNDFILNSTLLYKFCHAQSMATTCHPFLFLVYCEFAQFCLVALHSAVQRKANKDKPTKNI